MPTDEPLPLGVREAVGATDRARRVHAVLFAKPDATLRAVRALHAHGYHVADVHTPFPIHGLDEALGWPETRLPWATFAGGATGLVLGLGFQLWTHAVDWPLEIGGKTHMALPALAPVTFELTVLFAAFATVGALVFGRRLRPRARVRLASQPHQRVNDDRFVVLVLEQDGGFDPKRFGQLVASLEPIEVNDRWRVL